MSEEKKNSVDFNEKCNRWSKDGLNEINLAFTFVITLLNDANLWWHQLLVKWSKAIINYRHHLVSTDGNRIIHRRIFGLLVFQGPLSFLHIPYSFKAFSRWCADCMQAILMNFYLLSSVSLNIRTMFRCKLWRQSFFECIGPRFAGAKISLCSE